MRTFYLLLALALAVLTFPALSSGIGTVPPDSAEPPEKNSQDYGDNKSAEVFPSWPVGPDYGFFDDFDNLFREMDNLRKRMRGRFFGNDRFGGFDRGWPFDADALSGGLGTTRIPEIDFKTNGDILYITIKAEDLEKGEVSVAVTDNSLVISSNRREEDERTGKSGSYRRFSAGSFKKIVPLPVTVDEKNLKTTCEKGEIIIEAKILSGQRKF